MPAPPERPLVPAPPERPLVPAPPECPHVPALPELRQEPVPPECPPEGSFPMKILGGGYISSAWVAGPRAMATEIHDPPWPHKGNRPWSPEPPDPPWPPEALDPPWPPEAPDPPWPPEAPDPPWPSGSAMDAFPLSMSSSDIQGAHPPSQVLLLRRGKRRPGGGGTVREWPVSSITDRLHLHLIIHHAHLLLIITAHHPCST